MTQSKRIPSLGEAAKWLDAGMEHADIAWGRVRDPQKPHPPSHNNHDYEVGSAQYHLSAFISYVREAMEALRHHVTTEGQLCPYQDCCWDCGLDEAGWYICPHCGRRFWCRGSDSDVEDYACYREGARDDEPPKPIVIPIATDLGPSWGTPAEEKDVHPNYKGSAP